MSNDKIIAFCGILCSECPAYKATLAGDEDALAKQAAEWSSDDYPLTADDLACDGCLQEDKRVAKFCADCDVRGCALERGVENCAHCDAFPCEMLEKPWSMSVDAKTTLEEIRQMLKGSS
jgi:hypothetical protein